MKLILFFLGVLALVPFMWLMFMFSFFSFKNKYMNFGVMVFDNWVDFNDYKKEDKNGKEESGF